MRRISTPFFFSRSLLFFTFVALFIFSQALPAFAQTNSDGTEIHLMVENCNHNNICEPNLGENFQGCASDCMQAMPTSTPTTTTSGGGRHTSRTSLPEEIFSTVIPSSNSADISWKSDEPTRGTLSWGTTADYELGSIAEVKFSNDHDIKLSGLLPNTRYFYKIQSSDENGHTLFGQRQFFTLSGPDTIPPSNVKDIRMELKSDLSGEYIFASWINPDDYDLAYIRVVRSTDFYPVDPFDGTLVYDGTEASFEDHGISNDTDYYYSFFTTDVAGNFSSGALAHVKISGGANTVIGPISPSSLTGQNEQNAFSLSDLLVAERDPSKQGQTYLSFFGDTIMAEKGNAIILILPKVKLIPDTRYVLLSVQDANDPNTFNSYFLRSLNDDDSIEADLPPFNSVGNFSFFVTFLNENREVIYQTHGSFDVENSTENKGLTPWQHIHLWITQIIKWIRAFLTAVFWYL